MAVHFSEVTVADPSGGGWRTFELYFERVPNPPSRDKEVEKLVQRFDTLVDKLHLLARTQDDFIPLFNSILAKANASLATAGGKVADGNDSASRLEQELQRLWRKNRTRYFLTMTLIAGCASAVGFALSWGVSAFAPDQKAWLMPAVLALPGAALGVIFTAFATNKTPTYQFLGQFDPYEFQPWERYLWVVLLSLVMLAAMKFHLIRVSLGDTIKLDDFENHPELGFLIGLLCGVGEALIADALTRTIKAKVTDLLSRQHRSSGD